MFELDRFQRRGRTSAPHARMLARLSSAAMALLISLTAAVAQIVPLSPSPPKTPAIPPFPAPGNTATIGSANLSASAQFATDRKPIRSGLVWRVLVESVDGSPPRIVARSNDAEPVFSLEPGSYVLHAAYGFASGTKRVVLGPQGTRSS